MTSICILSRHCGKDYYTITSQATYWHDAIEIREWCHAVPYRLVRDGLHKTWWIYSNLKSQSIQVNHWDDQHHTVTTLLLRKNFASNILTRCYRRPRRFQGIHHLMEETNIRKHLIWWMMSGRSSRSTPSLNNDKRERDWEGPFCLSVAHAAASLEVLYQMFTLERVFCCI